MKRLAFRYMTPAAVSAAAIMAALPASAQTTISELATVDFSEVESGLLLAGGAILGVLIVWVSVRAILRAVRGT